MSWQKRYTIWPVLGILAGLFVLVVMSPRSWERKVRRSVAVRRQPPVVVQIHPTAGEQGHPRSANQGHMPERAPGQPKAGDQMYPKGGGPGQPERTGQPERNGDQKARRPVVARSPTPLQRASEVSDDLASKAASASPPMFSVPSASLRQNLLAPSSGQNVPDSAKTQAELSLSSPTSPEGPEGVAPLGRQTAIRSRQPTEIGGRQPADSGNRPNAERDPGTLVGVAPSMAPHSGGKAGEGEPADPVPSDAPPPVSRLAEQKEPLLSSASLPSLASPPGGQNPLRQPVLVQPAEPVAHAHPPVRGIISPKPATAEAVGHAAGPASASAGTSETTLSEIRSSEPSSLATPSDGTAETGPSGPRTFTGRSKFDSSERWTWETGPITGASETRAFPTRLSAGDSETMSSAGVLESVASETRGSEPPSEADPEFRPREARPSEQAEPAEPAWTPRALIAQLEAIADDPQAGPWARQVLVDLRALIPLLERRGPEAGMLLHRLTQLGRQSDAVEPLIADRRTFRTFRQIRFGLYRRLDLWSHWLQEPPQMDDLGGVHDLSEADWRQLTEALEELDRLTAHSPEGRGWRRYLLLDRLRELVARRQELSPAERRGLARAILERFSRRGLAPEQQRFLNTGPAGTVQQHLRLWAVEPAPETLEVLAHVEAYEATAQPSDAQRLAGDCQRLLFSAHPSRRALGEKLRHHYQNPNLRIVVTEDLLNRLIPPRDPEYQWVADTVLGVPVRGRSLIFTDVAVRTIPDPARIRLALEVTGRVSSMTTAFQGPAIFYNRSDAVYVARKPLEVGTFGIRLWPAEVEVRNSTRLRGLETDFDPIPLLGSIVQEVARSQHEARRWEADREVEAKLRARAKAQIDAEADARLTSVSRNLQEQILEPMASLGLGPEMVEAKTDSQRITMRLRIGGADHLGAHTPRPWAPSDSLASFQVHESAINNFLDRLDLAGRTFTLPELRRWVADRLHRPEFAQRQTEHDDLELTFAEQDPVVVRFQNGRFSVQLSIVYLRKGQNEWANFQVCAFYRPAIDGADARLVRDGVVHLRGELDMRSQIGLRGLFGKAFDKEKPLHISPEHISPDPRMRELMITQFVIEDGWAGVAIGPKQRSVPPEVARLPKGPASLGPIY